MKALILVDIQNDFLPAGALAVEGSDTILPVVNKIQAKFDLVVATQDWHPANHKSFASNHSGCKPFDEITLHGLKQILWPDHCIQGSRGAEFSAELNQDTIEAIFRKGTDVEIDSYSGFFDNGHRKTTALADYLKGKAVKEVFLCGLAGDICVYYTALDAVKEGFKTTLVLDGCKALDQRKFEKQLVELKEKGVEAVHSGELG